MSIRFLQFQVSIPKKREGCRRVRRRGVFWNANENENVWAFCVCCFVVLLFCCFVVCVVGVYEYVKKRKEKKKNDILGNKGVNKKATKAIKATKSNKKQQKLEKKKHKKYKSQQKQQTQQTQQTQHVID